MAERDDTTGRFLPGNKASPGRPRRSTEAEYLDSMKAAVSLEQWEKATAKMLKLALAGDVQAYRILAPYYAGLPVQKLQLSNGEAAMLGEILDAMKAQGLDVSTTLKTMLDGLNDDDERGSGGAEDDESFEGDG